MHHKMKTIRSQNQSYEINKVDDKRYILEDGIHSYAYGHFLINSRGIFLKIPFKIPFVNYKIPFENHKIPFEIPF